MNSGCTKFQDFRPPGSQRRAPAGWLYRSRSYRTKTPGFRRPRSRIVGTSLAPRAPAAARARRHRRRVREPGGRRGRDRQLGGEAAPMRATKRSRTCSSTKRLGAARTSVSAPAPASSASGRIQVLNCCAGSSCSSRRRAGVPEVLHLMVGRGELEFYLLRYELSTAASALSRQARRFDNALARTLLIPPFFRLGSDEADLSTI